MARTPRAIYTTARRIRPVISTGGWVIRAAGGTGRAVVDVGHFGAEIGSIAGNYHSDALHVVEKTPDADHIEIR